MSMEAVVEIGLHVEGFRNVDLFHQGLYRLKARVRTDGSNASVAARPCGILVGRETEPSPAAPLRTQPRIDHHCLSPPFFSEEDSTFSTRSFLIRYCEEEVEMTDVGLFRLELSEERVASGVLLLLEVDLMFADPSLHGGAERLGEQADFDNSSFRCCSTVSLRVRLPKHCCAHEFCPVVFDEFHFSSASIVFHSALLDYRLRLQPRAAEPAPATVAAPDGANSRQRMPETARRRQALVGRPGGALLTLEGFLFGGFPSTWDSDPQLQKSAEEVFLKYHHLLRDSSAELHEWYMQVCDQCLTLTQRDVLSPSSGSPPRSGEANLGFFSSASAMASRCTYELNAVACGVQETWQQVLSLIVLAPKEITMYLRTLWEERVARSWNETIIDEPARPDVAVTNKYDSCEEHAALANTFRTKVGLSDKEVAVIQDAALLPPIGQRPLVFEQRCGPMSKVAQSMSKAGNHCPSSPKSYRGVHLFVLVHGFQGNSFDMRLMKNNLAVLYPDAIFLCSNSNEENTDGDIHEMGIRLAQEVVNYICDWCPGSALGRLSFVAHSMGGLIARAALPHLTAYSSKMFTIMTLATSHLGIFQDKISLFNTGFWMLKKWKNTTFLQQISLTDHQDPRETFLYKLSKAQGFELFQNVVLVACFEDQYGPLRSARAEMERDWQAMPEKEVYCEMVRNIWANVQPERVRRLGVNFVLPERNLDSFIGRAAHIQFLECQPVMKALVHGRSSLFR